MDVRPGYKLTEAGVIPDEWEVSTVGVEFSVQLGKMLDAQRNSGIPKPYLGNKAVQWGRIDVGELPTVPMSPGDLDTFRLRRGDVLVCEGGEVGRAAIWEAPLDECYYQKALHRLRPIRGFEGPLIVAILRRWSDTGVLNDYVTQTSIAHLPRDKFVQVPIPCPPRPEQRAIVEVLSDADALLDGLDRLIAKKRDLKQAAMQQLLTGQTRLPGFSGEWEIKPLGGVGRCLRGVSYRGDTDLLPHDAACTKRLLRANNVQDSLIVTDDLQFVNEGRVSKDQILTKGDILVCMANGSKSLVGKAGLFSIEDGYEYTFGAFMACFRVSVRAAHPEFVFGLFQTGQYRGYIDILLAGSSINNLRPSSVESLEFRFPSLSEQTAVAAVLSDMDAELSALQARREKTHALKQAMMQELLTGRTRLV